MPAESWFYAGLGSLLQSSEQGIAIQSTIGGGVGRFVKNTNRASLAVLGGGAWQSTKYEHANAHLGQQNLAAAMVYAEAKMFRFSRTNLDLTAALLPSVSDSGRVRFNLNSTYYVKMFNNLKWDLSLYGNWDNRPPVGLSGSDYGTSAGITWTFGLK